MRLLLPLSLVLAFAAPAWAGQPAKPVPTVSHATVEVVPAVHPALAAAVADPRRDADRVRDPWRKPTETLGFFRIAPDMKVGEYAPGGGWYSRLLGLYLGPQGKFTGLFASSAPQAGEAARQRVRDAAARFPQSVAEWSGQPADRFAGHVLDAVPDSERGTFDRIIVMRMMHNMFRKGAAFHELAAIRALLKDDGLLGIEQHRARPDAPFAYAGGGKGYMRESDVIALIEAHGFKFVGKSEANANPRDPADWPDGVWTLPPTLSKGDQDREKYTAVGESDRMTLLFAKRP